MIALVENNPQSPQCNCAAVPKPFSDGNVPLNETATPPLTGVLAEAAYLKARFYADRHKANQL